MKDQRFYIVTKLDKKLAIINETAAQCEIDQRTPIEHLPHDRAAFDHPQLCRLELVQPSRQKRLIEAGGPPADAHGPDRCRRRASEPAYVRSAV